MAGAGSGQPAVGDVDEMFHRVLLQVRGRVLLARNQFVRARDFVGQGAAPGRGNGHHVARLLMLERFRHRARLQVGHSRLMRHVHGHSRVVVVVVVVRHPLGDINTHRRRVVALVADAAKSHHEASLIHAERVGDRGLGLLVRLGVDQGRGFP